MVYGIDILKVAAVNLKIDPVRGSPCEPLLQIDFVKYWIHAVLKAIFYSSCGFLSFGIFKILALTLIWTQLFELSLEQMLQVCSYHFLLRYIQCRTYVATWNKYAVRIFSPLTQPVSHAQVK